MNPAAPVKTGSSWPRSSSSETAASGRAGMVGGRGLNAATGARAAVRYAPQPWGTELAASVSGIPPGTRCQIWATTVGGRQAAGGSWTVTRGDPHAWCPASVPFPAGSLAGFDITAGDTVLVAVPLRPGTPPDAAGPASAP